MRSKTLIPAVLAALAFGLSVQAMASIMVILSSDSPIYQEALDGIKQSAPTARSVVMDAHHADIGGAQVVVSVGDAAAMLELPSGVKRVAAMVADFHTKPEGRPVNVEMLPDVFSLISLIGDLCPKLETLAVFSVGDHYQSYLEYLSTNAKIANDKVKIWRLESNADLVEALKSLPGKAQALWVVPDALFVSPVNFKLISDFCLASKIALIAPSPLLAPAGALAGLAPSPMEIGRAAGSAAQKLDEGKNPGLNVHPDKSESKVNLQVAQALGLRVPATLQKKN